MKLLIADMKCRKIQKAVFSKMGKRPDQINSFAAMKTEYTVYPNGITCINDLCYGEKYPNSFLDIWKMKDADRSCPTVVYFHGGGMLFGDKALGDPLAAEGMMGLIQEIVKRGFNLVSVNYALAPDYRFPSQPRQSMQALVWLCRNTEALQLNMDRVVIMGSSAGANITLLLGQALANPDYAAQLEIHEVIESSRIKALIADESVLSTGSFDRRLRLMSESWLGETDFVSGKNANLVVAQKYMTTSFFPTFVNSSNTQALFHTEALYTVAALEKTNAPHELFYRTQEEAGELPHGFVKRFATNPASKECFDRMIEFMRKYTQ